MLTNICLELQCEETALLCLELTRDMEYSLPSHWMAVIERRFMKSVSFINDLKLRASYGILGSQANINPANAFTLFGSNPEDLII